jgi:predicted CXXCH cytochrome family protein
VLAGTNVSLRKGGDALCTGCHAAYQGRSAGSHEKRLEGGCRECHQLHGGQGKSLLRDAGGGPCLRCHGDRTSQKDGGHPLPGEGGASSAGRMPGCTDCHPVHRPDEGKAARNSRCARCHPPGAPKGSGPAKGHEREEDCGLCHTFHARSGPDGRGLRGEDIRVDTLCGKCHARYWAGDVRAGRSSGSHVSVAGNKAGICLRCHKMHGAPAETALLRSPKPYACLDCHERQNTIRETGGIVLAHPVFERVERDRLTAVAKKKRLPVGPTGEIVCQTCHQVHFASPDTPLLRPGTEKEESCLWCHEGMRGKSHKGKAGGGRNDCTDCHLVHGNKDAGGDPWAALCQTCHPRPSLHRAGKEDRSVGRSSSLPEFDSRGRKTPFGTISCPTCHQPHGAAPDARRVRKNYRPNGFLCTSCHAREETIALTPHDLRGVAGNSVCEPCHVPHGGSYPWMWGFRRSGGEGGEEACRACHEGKGMGTPVPRGGHPRNMIPSRPLPERYPLIGPDGVPSRVGVISCPTCHEVHGTGMMPTGQGVGKLLRGANVGATSKFCSECHAGRENLHGKAVCASCHPAHSGKAPESACAECHGGQRGTLLAKHQDAGKGCGSCHRIHPGPMENKRAAAERGAEACLECHLNARKVMGSPHADMGSSPCDTCHPAHREPAVLAARPKLGEENFAPDLPCLRCHREGGEAPIPKWSKHPNRTQ